MEIRGSRTIPAARALVWDALNDPAVMRATIPGCTSFTGTPEDGFDATVSVRFGPVGTSVEGTVHLSDVIPLERYTLTAAARGETRARGGAVVTLSDAGAGTRLDYTVTVDVSGRLADLGASVIEGFATRIGDSFFRGFEAAILPPSPDAPAERRGWLRRLIGGDS